MKLSFQSFLFYFSNIFVFILFGFFSLYNFLSLYFFLKNRGRFLFWGREACNPLNHPNSLFLNLSIHLLFSSPHIHNITQYIFTITLYTCILHVYNIRIFKRVEKALIVILYILQLTVYIREQKTLIYN